MKKKLSIILILFSFKSVECFSQFQVGYSQSDSNLTFKMKPNASVTSGFALLEFFIRYADNTPSINYGPLVSDSINFPNMKSTEWKVEQDNPAYTIAGYHVDHFYYTAPAPITGARMYTMNQEYNVFRIPIKSVTNRIVPIELVHREPQDKYYLAIVDDLATTDRSTGDPATYFYPITLTKPGGVTDPSGTTYSADLSVVLPVKFKYLNILKTGNIGKLNWAVENENSNTEKYEVLVGTKTSDLISVKTIQPLFKENGKSSNEYGFNQDDLSSITSSGIIYFRIKQTDKDGKVSLSDIKTLRMNVKGLVAGVYPNPIKQSANVSFDLEKDVIVILSVTDVLGKQLQVKQIQGFKGANIRSIDMSKMAGGSYLLKVQAGDETKILPIVKATN